MSERAVSFVERWISENTDSEGFRVDLARNYAEQCLAAAKVSGIPESEINDEFDDLQAFLASEIEEANDRKAKSQTDGERR
jgi:hypothetical protein